MYIGKKSYVTFNIKHKKYLITHKVTLNRIQHLTKHLTEHLLIYNLPHHKAEQNFHEGFTIDTT